MPTSAARRLGPLGLALLALFARAAIVRERVGDHAERALLSGMLAYNDLTESRHPLRPGGPRLDRPQRQHDVDGVIARPRSQAPHAASSSPQ